MRTLACSLSFFIIGFIGLSQHWTLGMEFGSALNDSENSVTYQRPYESGRWTMQNTSASFAKFRGGFSFSNLLRSQTFAFRTYAGLTASFFESSGFQEYRLVDCENGDCDVVDGNGFFRSYALGTGVFGGMSLERGFGIVTVFLGPEVEYEFLFPKKDEIPDFQYHGGLWRNQGQSLQFSVRLGARIHTKFGYVAPYVRTQVWSFKAPGDHFYPELSQSVQLSSPNVQAHYWFSAGLEFGIWREPQEDLRDAEELME